MVWPREWRAEAMAGEALYDLPVDLLVEDLFRQAVELVSGEAEVVAQVPAPLGIKSLSDVVHLILVEGHGGDIDAAGLNFGSDRCQKRLAEAGIPVLDE